MAKIYYVPYTQPNKEGRVQFSLNWFDPNHANVGMTWSALKGRARKGTGKRGQMFMAVPAQQKALSERRGDEWVECKSEAEAEAALEKEHQAEMERNPEYKAKVS